MFKQSLLTLTFFAMSSVASAQVMQPRIIDGNDTSAEAHPSYVTVEVSGAMCGGTLIDSQWVLTAAHCLEIYGVPVSTSRINIAIHPSGTQNEEIQSKQWETAEAFYMHPDYDFPTDDIALIKLSNPVSSTVATLNNNSDELVGQNGLIVGLGSITRQQPEELVIDVTPEKLQQAYVPIVNRDVCSGYYYGVPDNLICAGFSDMESADACVGDSGGPLYVYRDGKKLQAGLVSFGAGCGIGAPGGYTDVSKYKSFIRQYAPAVAFAGGVETISNVTGVWYDPDYDGAGFTLMHSDNVLSTIYYGYRNNGLPQWLLSSTLHTGDVIKNQPFSMNLNTSANNNGATFTHKPQGANSGTSYWGTVQFSFTGCNSATATLSGKDGNITYNLIKLQGPKETICTE